MSVWAEVNGTISVHCEKHLSVTKAIKTFFNESVHVGDWLNNDIRVHTVSFAFCGDGINAANQVETFVRFLKETYQARVDLEVSIRFMA